MIGESLICQKHNQELKFCHPDSFDQKQELACRQCIDEFLHVIPIESLIKQNQEFIQTIISQAKSNSNTMNLLIHSLLSIRESILKKIENLIDEIRKQIKTNEDDLVDIQDNVLKIQKINSKYENSLDTQRLFQNHCVQQIENLKQNSGTALMIKTLKQLDLRNLISETQSNKINFEEIKKQAVANEFQVQQNKQIFQRKEYQLQAQSSIEHRNNCWAVAFNKEVSIVVAGSDFDIKIFEFKNDKLVEFELLKTHFCITSLQFMKKSNKFLSGSWDKLIKIWQLNNNNKWVNVETLVGHKDDVNCLIINQNEDLIISGSKDKQIIFWRLNNNKWSIEQVIKCAANIWSLSLNNTNKKLISSDDSKLIQIIEQKGTKWEITQRINTDQKGYRICFFSDSDFVFLPDCSEFLHFYNYNQSNKQFQKVDQLQIKNDGADIEGFPIQMINSQNFLIVKNGKFVNIVKQQSNNRIILEQIIELETHKIHGSVSDDGQFLILWNFYSKKIELRKLICVT